MIRSAFKIPNLRWVIAALLFLNTVNNYIDRQALAIVAPHLSHELGITNIQYGYITQAFLIAYTAMYFVSGLMIDSWGVRMVYGLATVWWSIAAMLHATVRSAFGLGCFQFLLGVGESSNFTAAQKVSGIWYPVSERGTVNGLVQAGAVSGAIVTPPMVVFLMTRFGWRWAFIAAGLLGLAWAAAWFYLYHSPEAHPMVTDKELALIREDTPPGTAESNRTSWTVLLRMRLTWGLLVARIFSDPVWWFYLFWMPKYLTDVRGFSTKLIGLTAWVPYLFSDAGSLIGGWASGRLVAGGVPVIRARKLVMLCSVLLMLLGVTIPFTPSSTLAIATISIVLFASMSWKTNLATLNVDLYPKPILASAAGLVGTGSGIGGALFTVVSGYIIQWHSYTWVFLILAVLPPIAYLIVHWTVRDHSAEELRLLNTSEGALHGTHVR